VPITTVAMHAALHSAACGVCAGTINDDDFTTLHSTKLVHFHGVFIMV